PHAGLANDLQQLCLSLATVTARFRETGTDDDEGFGPLLGGITRDRKDLVGRHDDDGQIDVARYLGETGIRGQALQFADLRVNGYDPAAEACRAQVVQDLRTDAATVAPGANDGHGCRLEKGFQRGACRDLCALGATRRERWRFVE